MLFEPLVVIHTLADGCRRRWVFEWKGREIVLQRYHLEDREEKLIQYYDSEDPGGYGDWEWLQEKDVPWDDELKGEVGLALVSKLRIRKRGEKF